MACLRWLPTRKINFAQKIHLFAKYVISCHEQRRLLMGTGKEFIQQQIVNPPKPRHPPASLCLCSLNVCCLWHLFLDNKGPSRLDLHPGSFIVRASRYLLWVVIYGDNSTRDLWRGADAAPDLGRMSLITELITHKLRTPALLFYCLLRVMLHVIMIVS